MKYTERVSSSVIDSLEYDSDDQILIVHFNNGSSYQYTGVSEDTFLALKDANSVGKYFSENIRNSYSFQRL